MCALWGRAFRSSGSITALAIASTSFDAARRLLSFCGEATSRARIGTSLAPRRWPRRFKMMLATRPFDPAEFLDTPEAVAEYLAAAFESADHAVIADALGVAAKARGMTQLARDTGLAPPGALSSPQSRGPSRVRDGVEGVARAWGHIETRGCLAVDAAWCSGMDIPSPRFAPTSLRHRRAFVPPTHWTRNDEWPRRRGSARWAPPTGGESSDWPRSRAATSRSAPDEQPGLTPSCDGARAQ